MISLDPDAKLNLVSATAIISRMELSLCRERESVVLDAMRRRMASQLASLLTQESALERTDAQYGREYRARFYVVTPMQLEKYVQRRAERLGYASPVRFLEDDYIKPI